MTGKACPSPDLLHAYLLGTLPFSEARSWDEHFLCCPQCAAAANSWDHSRKRERHSPSLLAKTDSESDLRFQESIARFVIRHAPPANGARNGQHLNNSEIPLVPGTCLGNYRLLAQIGRGGMGIVYQAKQIESGNTVALKIILPSHLETLEAVRRFRREIEVVFRLHHPHIVEAFDAGLVDGIHFLVLEFVEGGNLCDRVRQHGPLPLHEAVQYTIQAAQGLQYAHELGIVHRDVKPHNLLIDNSNGLKITDMGLARATHAPELDQQLTNTGIVLGSAEFLSPEQALDSRDADSRSDIYALGCTLYYLLAARPVYSEATPLRTLLAHRDSPIPSLQKVQAGVPIELDRIFHKMLAKRPQDRVQSMAEVAIGLKLILPFLPQ